MFPVSGKSKLPSALASVWKSSANRLKGRAKASGFKNAKSHWGEAAKECAEGRLEGAREISPSGDIDVFAKGCSEMALGLVSANSKKLERAAIWNIN